MYRERDGIVSIERIGWMVGGVRVNLCNRSWWIAGRIGRARFGCCDVLAAAGASVRAQMAVESVCPRKGLAAAFAKMLVGLCIVQRIVPLAVVLASESLVAIRPLAHKRTLFCMGAQMTSEVESASKCAAAAWHGALELGIVATARGAGSLCCGGGHMLLLDLEDRGEPWNIAPFSTVCSSSRGAAGSNVLGRGRSGRRANEHGWLHLGRILHRGVGKRGVECRVVNGRWMVGHGSSRIGV